MITIVIEDDIEVVMRMVLFLLNYEQTVEVGITTENFGCNRIRFRFEFMKVKVGT